VSESASGKRPLDVFLVAGETSGDLLGAALMKKLREQVGNVRFRGVGGPEMQVQGLASQFSMSDITAMGFGQVIAKLPLILRRIRETVSAIKQSPPDILVLIDSPDFNQRVAKRVRRALPDLPIVKYVSPTVWVWRPGRAKKLKPLVDHILALFPFEPEVHKRLGGPPTSYVGHPLLEKLAELRPSKAEEELRNREPPLLLVLPGSRTSEIERLAPLFGQVVHLIAQKQTIEVVLPTIPSQVERVKAHVTNWPVKPRIVTGESEKYSAFRRARAALAASGTVTLELALAHVPMAAAYRVPRWEELIARRFAVATSAILPNIILGERVVPELLQQDATVEKMAAVLAPLLTDSPERARQIAGFARLDEIFDTGTKTASERAAKIVMEVYENKRKVISAPQHLR
jgi:lipid-A-disaccharide synthase